MEGRIAVVGAGMAGLAAAYVLKQAGASPIVLESESRAGGRMISDHSDGFTIDAGAQFLTDDYHVIPKLAKELGIAAKIVPVAPYIATVRAGKMRRVRVDRDLTPLRSGLLGPGAWLRFGLSRRRLLTQIGSLSTHDIVAWAPYDDLGARQWSMATFGHQLTDYITEPQIGGLFFQSLEENSRVLPMAMQLGLLYRKPRIQAVRGGIGSIPQSLASRLDVRVGSRVDSLSLGERGVELTAGREQIIADAAILATPASVSKRLHAGAGGIESTLLSTPYSSSMTVALMLGPEFHLDPRHDQLYGVFIPVVEGGEVASFNIGGARNHDSRGDGQLINVFLRSQSALEMMDWEDSRIVSSVAARIDQYLPGVKDNLVGSKLYRWKEAIPLTPVGRARAVARYRQSLDPSARLVLAGDYMGMPYTDGAAESGIWAAEALLKGSL